MSRLKEIQKYLIGKGADGESLKPYNEDPVRLSGEIMEYAHRDQKRENGEAYANHPTRCLQNYRDLVGIVPDDLFCIDKDLLYRNGIPFDGVQEVCLLHDVVEDTDFTIGEIEEIFDECGLGDYFRLYMKTALTYITHDKTMDYEVYVGKICTLDPVASICKMMDLQDNLYILSLRSFDEKNYRRAERYLECMYLLNQKYRFIENAGLYRKALAEAPESEER